MFRTCLHPTRFGFVGGIVVIALWALLWTWFLVAIVHGAPEREARQPGSLPELALAITCEVDVAG